MKEVPSFGDFERVGTFHWLSSYPVSYAEETRALPWRLDRSMC